MSSHFSQESRFHRVAFATQTVLFRSDDGLNLGAFVCFPRKEYFWHLQLSSAGKNDVRAQRKSWADSNLRC
jgi:hypothetical protein